MDSNFLDVTNYPPKGFAKGDDVRFTKAALGALHLEMMVGPVSGKITDIKEDANARSGFIITFQDRDGKERSIDGFWLEKGKHDLDYADLVASYYNKMQLS